MKKIIRGLLISVAISGCAKASIIRVSTDTYVISKSDHSPGFGNSSTLKGEVQAEANNFAEKQNKVAVPVSIHSTPAFPLHFATVEYRFRVLDKNDPEAIRALRTPSLLEEDGKHKVDARPKSSDSESTYEKLMKLDELKKREYLLKLNSTCKRKRFLMKSSVEGS